MTVCVVNFHKLFCCLNGGIKAFWYNDTYIFVDGLLFLQEKNQESSYLQLFKIYFLWKFDYKV